MMKFSVCAFVLLSGMSSFASVKYKCSVANYVSADDERNSVENLVVTLDGEPARALLPLSKKRVTLSLLTFQTKSAEIKKYGQYQLFLAITEDKDNVNQADIQVMAGSTFVGLDPALQVKTIASFGGKPTLYDVGVLCNRL